MDRNKVRFGISNLHIAFFAEDSAPKAPKWDAPIHVPGAVGFTPEPQSGQYTFRADNMAYYTTLDSDNYTGSLELALIPDAILAEMFGWVLDDLGGLLQVQGGEKKNFALMGQFEGDKSGRRFVYYNVTASIPAEQGTTKAETVTAQTQTMSIAMNPIELDEARIGTKYALPYDASAEGNAEVYNNFFDEVYIPPVATTTTGTEP